MASSACEIMSGGVSNIPKTKQPTMMYGLFFASASGVVIPDQIISTAAMGISKAIPKAKRICESC